MGRVSLAELKKALSKIPDKELEDVFITHTYATDEPDDKLSVVKGGEDYSSFFDKYETSVINKFTDAVFEDAKKIIASEILGDAERYIEDSPFI